MDFLDTVIGDRHNRLVDWITIHPRTRNTASTIPIRDEALNILTAKYGRILPILLSGDVFDLNSLPFAPALLQEQPTFETLTLKADLLQTAAQANGHAFQNAKPTPSNTYLSGFMSARGLLCNPALFAGHTSASWDVVETFMCNVARCPLPLKLVVHHVQEMCAPGMGSDKTALLSKKERARLVEITDMTQLVDFLDDMIMEKTGRADGLRRDL